MDGHPCDTPLQPLECSPPQWVGWAMTGTPEEGYLRCLKTLSAARLPGSFSLWVENEVCGLKVGGREMIFSVWIRWFLSVCLCRWEASRGRQVEVRSEVSTGQEEEAEGECQREWPKEKSRFELEASDKGGWKLLGWWTPGDLGNAFLGRAPPLPHTSHLFHLT